jgi:tetratricopeptide (TPR) repeat protein
VLRAGDQAAGAPADTGRVLYLRASPIARRALLSFDTLAADVYWLRAIQHYGRDRKSLRQTGRFELLYPMLDLATSLDPQFNIVYRFGAVFLAEPPPSGPGRVDQAIALLQKGLRNSPGRWQYAFDIGFIYYWYGTGVGRGTEDFAEAASWFERAGAMPEAPVWLRQLAATTRAGGGDLEGARRLLEELLRSDEQWVRDVAAKGLAQIAVRQTLTAIQDRIDAFSDRHHRWPRDWQDLTGRASPPLDPAGVPYEYDAAAHRAELSPSSPLYPLPRTPESR